jgi:hypothetical protein
MSSLVLVFALFQAGSAEELANAMTGLWSSAEQSVSEAYDYVVSETVRIPGGEDGAVRLVQQNWIFGESAEAAPDIAQRSRMRPYFQVVIALRPLGEGEVHTTTYRIDRAASSDVGAWVLEREAGFDEAWITEAVCMGTILRVGEGYWQGRTRCPNGYKGGSVVDTRTLRTPDAYVNWDRGYDLSGRLVWGPPGGGYIFRLAEGGTD